MKRFMGEDFLLNNDVAYELYHNYAKEMPIYDYHCHLSAKEIAEDKVYENMSQIWLAGDHYKWRGMRSNGVKERYITGDTADYQKFLAFAKTLPQCIGNPLYHWSHLELQKYFGIEEVLNEDSAHRIWVTCNDLLKQKGFSARGLIQSSNVDVICTTDDPIDSLVYHKQIAEDAEFNVKVLPTFRPDKAMNIQKEGFTQWVEQLSKVTDSPIQGYEDFIKALEQRVTYFHEVGCRISDHSLEKVAYEAATQEELKVIFDLAMDNHAVTAEQAVKFQSALFKFFGSQYAKRGWAMQLHIGALRNNNTRMFNSLGADSGFDSIDDGTIARPLSSLLDALDKDDQLPKTILYCLNPKDNEVLGTMIGNFQGGIPGKIQFGSGWWFNDQKDGMIRQMTALSHLGLLSRFVGMVTDSRSFLSYTRHEYFRRVLCNIVGQWVEDGEAPNDMKLIGGMIQNICYNNAAKYFDI